MQAHILTVEKAGLWLALAVALTPTLLAAVASAERAADRYANARKEARMDRELLRLLRTEYGRGEDQVVRERLYRRLASLVTRCDDGCRQEIKQLMLEAKGKGNPGRWFCRAVLLRLGELGYIPTRETAEARAAEAKKNHEAVKRSVADSFNVPTE